MSDDDIVDDFMRALASKPADTTVYRTGDDKIGLLPRDCPACGEQLFMDRERPLAIFCQNCKFEIDVRACPEWRSQ
jgi:ribosomal protein S27AE